MRGCRCVYPEFGQDKHRGNGTVERDSERKPHPEFGCIIKSKSAEGGNQHCEDHRHKTIFPGPGAERAVHPPHRFGRIALVFQSLDETESGVWNQQTRSWDSLDSSYRSAIRQGLRIARKQAAPDLIRLPLPAASGAGGAI